MRYRLVADYPTATFRSILVGRKRVGRVTRHAEGDYVAVINKNPAVRAGSERAAFELAVARDLGFSSVAALQRHNAAMRDRRAALRQQASEGAREFFHAKTLDERFAALDRMFGFDDGSVSPEKLDAGFGEITRTIFGRQKR